MKKPPDPEPILSQPILQRSLRPLSPSLEAVTVQFLLSSGGNMRMPTVSCQIDGETMMTSTILVESRCFGVIFGRDDAVQRISSPKDTLCSTEGRLIGNGNRFNLNAVPGVFVPLSFSVFLEVVMGVCPDCSWILIRSLFLGALACRVKAPNHQNPPIALCFRDVLFDLFPKSPAMFFSWMLSRFLGCCYVLIIDNPLVYSFDYQYSWAQSQLDCWLIFRLCNWLVNAFYRLNLINVIMWNIVSEASHCIANCNYTLCIIPVSVGHVCSRGPGCVARISVAPSFDEQPDPGTPRFNYSWLKGSMRQTVNFETPYRFLLLHFWCLKIKVVSGMVAFFMNVSLVKAISGILRKRNKVWLYELDNQYGKYIMVVSSCSFINTDNFCQCWFNYLCISCDCFLCQSPVSLGDYCVCWLLITSQFGWDEVKGIWPFVYKDTQSETSHCNLLLFGMVGLSSKGGWFIIILMTLSSSLTTVWLILTLSWGLLSFWLSLLMVSLYAQMLGTLCSNICWHLDFLQNGWDEVKGQSLIVNEDAISETNYFVLMTLTKDTFRFDWYFVAGIRTSPCLHAQWPESLSETYGRVLGTRSSLMVQGPLMPIIPFSYGSRPSLMQLLASKRVNGKKDQVLSNLTFMCWLYFDMFWVYMIAFLPLSIVLNKAVKWLLEALGYLFYGCSLWFDWFVAQHGCVLGPCLTALEQHPPMLGLARRGLRIKYIPCVFVVSHHGMSGPCIMALARHRKMLETAHDGLGQCSGCVFLRQFFLFDSSYGISCFETDHLALRQGYVVPSVSLSTH